MFEVRRRRHTEVNNISSVQSIVFLVVFFTADIISEQARLCSD